MSTPAKFKLMHYPAGAYLVTLTLASPDAASCSVVSKGVRYIARLYGYHCPSDRDGSIGGGRLGTAPVRLAFPA